MNEIWKPCKDYESRYEVSNLGRVVILPKKIKRKMKDGKNYMITLERFMKMEPKPNGYLIARFVNENGYKNFPVHRLVAEAFIPKVKGKNYINHKNSNPSDNRVENLEWCTPSENLLHAYDNSRRKKEKTAIKKSKYRNVYWRPEVNKWLVKIHRIKTYHNIGYFDNEIDACLAAQKARIKLKYVS